MERALLFKVLTCGLLSLLLLSSVRLSVVSGFSFDGFEPASSGDGKMTAGCVILVKFDDSFENKSFNSMFSGGVSDWFSGSLPTACCSGKSPSVWRKSGFNTRFSSLDLNWVDEDGRKSLSFAGIGLCLFGIIVSSAEIRPIERGKEMTRNVIGNFSFRLLLEQDILMSLMLFNYILRCLFIRDKSVLLSHFHKSRLYVECSDWLRFLVLRWHLHVFDLQTELERTKFQLEKMDLLMNQLKGVSISQQILSALEMKEIGNKTTAALRCAENSYIFI